MFIYLIAIPVNVTLCVSFRMILVCMMIMWITELISL